MNIYKITLEVDFCFICELNERNGENVERDIDTRKRNPLKGFWLKTSYSLNTYGFFLLSPSRMSQSKHIAVLRGVILQDVATGQMFMLHPTDEDSRGECGSIMRRLMDIGGTT